MRLDDVKEPTVHVDVGVDERVSMIGAGNECWSGTKQASLTPPRATDKKGLFPPFSEVSKGGGHETLRDGMRENVQSSTLRVKLRESS